MLVVALSNFNALAFKLVIKPSVGPIFTLAIVAWLRVPIVVRPGAEVTVEPKAVSVKTEFVLILIPLPDARSIFSELVQESVPSFHTKVLLPCDEFSMIPPSSTAASFPTVPSSFLPKSIFLSSTTKVVTSIDVCVPLTTRLPSMFTSPPTSKVLLGDALKYLL